MPFSMLKLLSLLGEEQKNALLAKERERRQREHERAIAELKRQAEAGDADAQREYALEIETTDLVEAAKYFKLSSQTSPLSLWKYGQILEFGRGVPVNLRKAAECYKASIEQYGCPFDIRQIIQVDIDRVMAKRLTGSVE
jgi:hypothetical protein